MKDVVGKILEHPFATMAIIFASGSAIATVVNAIKGTKLDPVIKVDIKGKDDAK